MDVMLKTCDGKELMAVLKDQRRMPRIVVLNNAGTHRYFAPAENAGKDWYVEDIPEPVLKLTGVIEPMPE